MTTLAQGTRMRCDKAGCDATATIDQDAWSFCAQHADAPVHHRRPRPSVAPPAPPAPLAPVPKPVVDLDQLTPQENRYGIRPAEPGPTGLLLEQASGHSVAKVRRAGAKIETQLDQLRTLIADLAEDENRRQAEAAAKAKAKADIARLEQQLAAAKAALRGKPAAPASSSVTDRRRAPMVCRKGCGKVCGGAQGRAGHERHCAGVA